jgi:hypothetical protein
METGLFNSIVQGRPMQNFIEVCKAVLELTQADGWTDRQI